MNTNGVGPVEGGGGGTISPAETRWPADHSGRTTADRPDSLEGTVRIPASSQVSPSQAWPRRDEQAEPSWEELEQGLRTLPPPQSMPLRALRRLVLLALVIVLVCAGLGGAVWFVLPAEYASRAELLYPVAVEQPTGFLREDRNLTTQVLLIGSRAVVEPVAAANGIPVEDLQKRLTVEVVDSSEIIRLEVRSGERTDAVRLAEEITKRYLEISAGTRDAPARGYVTDQLDLTRRSLAAAPEDPGLLERERALVAQLDSLTTADLARPEPALLVTPFPVPDPVSPGVGTTVFIGALVGAVVAASIVLVRARRRSR